MVTSAAQGDTGGEASRGRQGDGNVSERVLIAYASRCGSTSEVAAAIAQELTAQGQLVDVRGVREVPDLDGYRAVMVGSAVRFGKWLPEAVRFVERNRMPLSRVPTAFFTVHALALDEGPASQRERHAYLETVRRYVLPRHEAFFAGEIDPARLSFGERWLARLVRAPEGDLRDWERIRGWARQINQELVQ